MAARADRSRGLLRRAKAMASPSAKVVGGSGDRWLGSPGLTTVSAGLTFRSGEIRTRAVTAASETSGGMGKGRCQEAQPVRKRRGTSTPVRHSSLRAAAARSGRKGRGISELGVKRLLPSESIAPCCSDALGGTRTDCQSVVPHGRCLSPLVARSNWKGRMKTDRIFEQPSTFRIIGKCGTDRESISRRSSRLARRGCRWRTPQPRLSAMVDVPHSLGNRLPDPEPSGFPERASRHRAVLWQEIRAKQLQIEEDLLRLPPPQPGTTGVLCVGIFSRTDLSMFRCAFTSSYGANANHCASETSAKWSDCHSSRYRNVVVPVFSM